MCIGNGHRLSWRLETPHAQHPSPSPPPGRRAHSETHSGPPHGRPSLLLALLLRQRRAGEKEKVLNIHTTRPGLAPVACAGGPSGCGQAGRQAHASARLPSLNLEVLAAEHASPSLSRFVSSRRLVCVCSPLFSRLFLFLTPPPVLSFHQRSGAPTSDTIAASRALYASAYLAGMDDPTSLDDAPALASTCDHDMWPTLLAPPTSDILFAQTGIANLPNQVRTTLI